MSKEVVGPPVGGRDLQRPAGRSIAMSAAAVPIHRAERLSFVHTPDRDEAWRLLGTSVRERLHHRAGIVADWWAYTSDEGRVHAVVLGGRAMVSATPTVNQRGGPAHLVEAVRLRAGSARTVAIVEDTNGSVNSAGASCDVWRGAPSMNASLSAGMRGFLGNLPAQAQRALQEPFLGTDQLYYGYHYNRTASTSGFGEERLQVFAYLYDRAWLTCLSGTGTTFGDAFDRARWDLVCRRAAVETWASAVLS